MGSIQLVRPTWTVPLNEAPSVFFITFVFMICIFHRSNETLRMPSIFFGCVVQHDLLNKPIGGIQLTTGKWLESMDKMSRKTNEI